MATNFFDKKNRLRLFHVPCVCVVVALLGCDLDKNKQDQPQQVMVKINSSEITLSEVDAALSKSPGLTTANLPSLRNAALEKLIDQELAVERALDQKLDRSPEVGNAIETAKRKVLAEAYLQQLIWRMPKPSAAEVHQYYEDHPELFAQRRVYELRVLALDPSPPIRASIHNMIGLGRSLDEIGDVLQSRKIPYSIESGSRAAEQLPFETLKKLASVKEGSVVEIETSSGLQLLMLKSSKVEAVDIATAYPNVEHFLFNQKASELTKKELERLRQNARIEYPNDSIRPHAGMVTALKAPSLGDSFSARSGAAELYVTNPR